MSAPLRRGLLVAAIRYQRGVWTSGRVRRLYEVSGYRVPRRKTCRDDLALLARQGTLTQLGADNRRGYVLNSMVGKIV